MNQPGFQIQAPVESKIVVSESRRPDSCIIVVFGATGDLANRKLFPSFYHLMVDGKLPINFAIVGLATRDKDDETFRNEVKTSMELYAGVKPENAEQWQYFRDRLYFVAGDFHDPAAFGRLRERLAAVDAEHGTQSNYLFFFATPASMFVTILTNLHESNLIRKTSPDHGAAWSRIMVEKPFGNDLPSARALNQLAGRFLDESQIFRIDHYLGKETVQNILIFRFGNAIFEPIWNSTHISQVQISASETLGIERRGLFYDQTGVLRDVVQNHLLEILVLCAMEPPISFNAEEIRNEKTKVFRSLHHYATLDEIKSNVVLGQYRGYCEEPNVNPDSRIPTYAALRVMIDNWRWHGVPFFLRAGKKLTRRTTEVEITFREVPACLFKQKNVCSLIQPNVLTLKIQPEEGISLRFVTKVPGDDLAVSNVLMDFNYATAFQQQMGHEAYERLFLEAMRGDQTLFARADGVELSWAFIDPIIQGFDQLGEKPPSYEQGSRGPVEADSLFTGDQCWKGFA